MANTTSKYFLSLGYTELAEQRVLDSTQIAQPKEDVKEEVVIEQETDKTEKTQINNSALLNIYKSNGMRI